jgi:hypothetical protein
MAQKIQTLFIDDIDGGEAEGTVRFALDGNEFEIDLNSKHSNELRSTLVKYISHARKVGSASRKPGTRGVRKPAPVDTGAVRAWARQQGIDIKERGRVPASVVAAIVPRRLPSAISCGGHRTTHRPKIQRMRADVAYSLQRAAVYREHHSVTQAGHASIGLAVSYWMMRCWR